ncbi:MAG: hypothetical protein RBT51_10685 [Ectothiorhodospiraceae bacterium]|jgi:hypothetical protein|nr:hypothetical protein [Ectothiorhodospiraceae bacterium]
MDAQDPTLSTTASASPGQPDARRHFLLVLASLVAGALLLHAGLFVHLLTAGAARHWHGSELQAPSAGKSVGKSASIDATATGLTVSRPHDTGPLILTAMKDPFRQAFDAALYDRVIVEIETAAAAPGVVLLWTRADDPKATHSQALQRDATGRFVVGLAGHPRWHQRIIGLGIALTGDLSRPVTVSGITLMPRERIGIGRMFSQVWKEWAALEGWGWHSVNFVVGGTQGPIMSPVVAVGIWVVLSIGVYLLLARRARAGVRMAAIFGIFLVGWLLLDLRWQIDLLHQNRVTWESFAGKSWEEKRAADWDGVLFQAVEDAKRRMGPEPQRLIIFSTQEDETIGYIAYHAIPHTALATKPPEDTKGFRPGDYVLILAPAPGVDYRALDRSLIWRGADGLNVLPADPVHFKPQTSALFRVREP